MPAKINIRGLKEPWLAFCRAIADINANAEVDVVVRTGVNASAKAEVDVEINRKLNIGCFFQYYSVKSNSIHVAPAVQCFALFDKKIMKGDSLSQENALDFVRNVYYASSLLMISLDRGYNALDCNNNLIDILINIGLEDIGGKNIEALSFEEKIAKLNTNYEKLCVVLASLREKLKLSFEEKIAKLNTNYEKLYVVLASIFSPEIMNGISKELGRNFLFSPKILDGISKKLGKTFLDVNSTALTFHFFYNLESSLRNLIGIHYDVSNIILHECPDSLREIITKIICSYNTVLIREEGDPFDKNPDMEIRAEIGKSQVSLCDKSYDLPLEVAQFFSNHFCSGNHKLPDGTIKDEEQLKTGRNNSNSSIENNIDFQMHNPPGSVIQTPVKKSGQRSEVVGPRTPILDPAKENKRYNDEDYWARLKRLCCCCSPKNKYKV